MKEVSLEKKKDVYGKMIILYINEIYPESVKLMKITESYKNGDDNLDQTIHNIFNNYNNVNLYEDSDLWKLYEKYNKTKLVITHIVAGDYFKNLLNKSKTINFTDIKEKIPSELLVREEDEDYTH